MESPTRLSQSRFFRFGRLSKASRKSSSGYSNQSFTAHPVESGGISEHHHLHKSSMAAIPVDSSYAGSDVIYQQLNHRSASMSTLPSSMPSGMYSPLPPYAENFGVHHQQPRLSQLQTLEAKMASIAVSLSGGGGGRRSAASMAGSSSLPPPPLPSSSGLIHQHHPGHRGSASVAGSKASSIHSGSTGRSSSSKHIRQEIDLLRKIIQDKDALIQTLQQRQQQHQGMATMPHVNGSIGSRATSNERQQVERRLAIINRDIELKRAAIKNIRLSLQQTSVSDNIDSRIHQAETEYQLEREETNLLNLQDEKRTLLLRYGPVQQPHHQQTWPGSNNNRSGLLAISTSLFRILHGHVPLVIVISQIDYDCQSPCFKLHYQQRDDNNPTLTSEAPSSLLDTCTVQWAREDLNLKPGDKVLEINGQVVLEQEKLEITKMLVSGPMELVVARPSREEAFLGQIHDLSTKVERLVQERDGLKGENLRLKHRISYLEEMRHDEDLQVTATKTNSSQQQADSLSSNDSQSVFRSEVRVQQPSQIRQKPPRTSKLNKAESGEQQNINSKIIVADPVQPPTPPETNSNSSGGSSGRIKTSSIVDRHFGHVIRVTHHHHHPPPAASSTYHRHPHHNHPPADSVSVSDLQSVASYDSFAEPSRQRPEHHHHNGSISRRFNNQQAPPSPTRSEVQSVASMDLDVRHHHRGRVVDPYTSGDDQSVSSSVNLSGILTKKPKPVPPRKPSFLYLNRASSLQSVNGVTPGKQGSASTHSMDRSLSSNNNKQSSIDEEWPVHHNNNTAPSSKVGHSLRSLKWNILSSSSRSSKGSRSSSKERESSRDRH